MACFEHPNFLTVNATFVRRLYTKFGETFAGLSTTSFLTATTLIYATGAGITAAAGTRLALQLFLAKNFILSPTCPILLQWTSTALLLPGCSRPLLLRNRTLIPRYPLKPW
eukprot:maker-scaffold_114-snap-gene-0.11-mRNA-1 protein AED:0.68 eAED:0.76 QI:0/0/0/1/0/0/2/0/110